MMYEGLQHNDLKHLINRVFSIDEFVSKIDDNAIVVGFFLKDIEPAKDLNRFIQKSSIPTIDVEVSPAPTQDGEYVVFVELIRDDNFPNVLNDLLTDISNLAGDTKWSFTAYHQKGKIPYNIKNIKKYIRFN